MLTQMQYAAISIIDLGTITDFVVHSPVTTKRAFVICFLAAGLVGVVLFWIAKSEDDRTLKMPVAYIVCGDAYFRDYRVYRIDLINGGVLAASESIDWMGNPKHLAMDAKRSRLYIGSFRGKARDYYPITVVNIQDSEFEVVNRFSTNPKDVLPRDSTQHNSKPYEVYQIAVPPNGNELYVMHGGLSEGMLRAVWDADTGEVLRELETYVRPSDVWSPDGHYVAGIWPNHVRTVQQNGTTTTEKITAGVDVRDVRTGKRVSLTWLEDGKELHPPWNRIDGSLIRLHGTGRILAHDRDTGDVIADFNIDNLTGLNTFGGVRWDMPPVFDDNQTIVLSMIGFEKERTYVVAIDVLRQSEVSRTGIGANCTNPVLAYEKISR